MDAQRHQDFRKLPVDEFLRYLEQRPKFNRALTRAYWKLKPYKRKWWERLR